MIAKTKINKTAATSDGARFHAALLESNWVGGESPAALAARTRPAFEELARRFEGGTVAVVAHLWVVRSALAAALGLPMSRSSQLGLPPGGICELAWPSAPGASPRLVRLGA